MVVIRLLLVLFAYFIFIPLNIAQSIQDFNCGFDALRNADQEQEIRSFDTQLSLYLSKKKESPAAQKAASPLPYTVPVVVHVIHNGGPENIPDAQILAAIDHLNEGFAAQGYFAQLGATANSQIQFCMAKRDPDGHATNGITRTQSPLTNMFMETQDIQTKDLNRWNPYNYVNIWVVKEITSISLGPSVAGYAYYPTAHGQPRDGMVCEAQFFGASPSEDAVLIHEMGHYFGLYHTFEGGCKNDNCLIDGDKVCDTPPDIATHTTCPFNSCSTDVAAGSPFLTDVDDYTGDFLDYSPFSCYYFFTAGQAARMQASLETARSSLLQSEGCITPCTQPIVVDFTVSPDPIVAGQTITFTNNSSGASNFSWEINGQFISNQPNITYNFPAPGSFTASLTATNSDPNCLTVLSKDFAINCPYIAEFSADQTDINIGQTVVFTNNSTGNPGSYEWSINGFSLASTSNLSYLFQNAGYYSVKLKAVGANCSSEKMVIIHVKAPCGEGINTKVQLVLPDGQFYVYDIITLADGSSILSGTSNKRPALIRIAANGTIIWHKPFSDQGEFWDMEPLGNGEFVVLGKSTTSVPWFLKFNEAGVVIWAKTLANGAGLFGGLGQKVISANPDGSFGFLIDLNDGLNLGKINADGTLNWTTRFPYLSWTSELVRATDGSGDFLIASGDGAASILVLRVSQSGVLLKGHEINFPQEDVHVTNTISIGTHANGDFSIVALCRSSLISNIYEKYIVRCKSDGQAIWAKKIKNDNGVNTLNLSIHKSPDNGWVLLNYKVGGSGYIMRLTEDGDLLWNRRLLNNYSVSYAAQAQDGFIRFPSYYGLSNNYTELITIPDSNTPLSCLSHDTLAETVTNIPVIVTPGTEFVLPKNFITANAPVTQAVASISSQITCSEFLPCPEICDNQLDDDSDGYVDCYDTDCPCIDTDTACIMNPPLNNFAAKLAWQSTADAASVLSVPIVANLNPQKDSIPEIIICETAQPPVSVVCRNILIFKGDGSNASNPCTLVLPVKMSNNPIPYPTVADLDGNGIPELIVVTYDLKIRVYTDFDPNATPCMKPWVVSSQDVGSPSSRAYVADFDGDGIGEIFSGNDVFKLDLSNPVAPTLTKVLDGSGGEGKGQAYGDYPNSSTAADLLSRSDCNGDPDCDGLEIAAGYSIYSVDIDPSDGDGYEIKIQRDLNLLDLNVAHNDGFSSVADLDLDGTPEIIVSGRRGNAQGFYVWNKNGLVQVFTPDFSNVLGMICVAEVYDDKKAGFAQNYPELIATSNNRIFCMNLQKAQSNPAVPYWWILPTTDDSGFTGATVFDFNGDGISEIVYRDHQNLRIMYGGPAPFPAGVDAERNWFKTPTGSGTLDEYPVVADVDNDGAAEIAVAGYTVPFEYGPPFNQRGRLRIFESANLPWLPARPIWNQFNYFGVNINDDLTVPKVQQKHWLEMGGIGSGQRPLNTHLAQTPPNPLTINKIKVPDATVSIDSTVCRTDSFDVFLNICNMGSAVLPSGTPIAFYNGDPTSTAAPLLFPPILLSNKLEKGACLPIKLKVPATYNTTIFVVINDDGSKPRPFDLMVNFPSTNQAECHYENNMASFNFPKQTPTLNLGPDILLCQNSVVELVADPNFQRYRWQNGSTNPTFTAYAPGKYWVDAFDACGFRQTDTVNIALNTLAALDLPDELSICEGASLKLSASGFPKYKWTPGDSLSCSDCASVDFLAKSSTTVHLTASNGNCFVSDSVRVQVNPKPIVQLQVQDGDCHISGSISALISGAAPFDIKWSDSSSGTVLNATASGTYSIEITDKNGCQIKDSAAVSVANALLVSANSVSPACANTQTGSIDLTVNSGTLPFQFLWSNSAATEDLNNVPAGSYAVVTSDANGCTTTLSVNLSDPPALALSLQKIDPLCAGEPSGAINLTAGGGTGNLAFLWSNSAATEDLNNLLPGDYTVVITDANGCTAAISETLTGPPALSLSLQKTDPLCAGAASGTLNLTASGGTGNLAFLWSNSAATEDLNNLSPGNYTVVTTDANGCTAAISETLTEPPALDVSLQKTNPPCTGNASGAINLNASGGTGNLTFLWSNTATTEDLSDLLSGNYTVTITDENGCTADVTATLIDPPGLVLSLQKTDPLCAGEASGALHLTVSGNAGSTTILWSNNAVTADLNNLPAGNYSVLITDTNGCTATISETLTAPPALALSLQKTDPLCAGKATGALNLTANGGTGNLNFLWSNSVTAEDLSNLPAGTYSVVTSDANGCSATISETLTEPPVLVLSLQKTDINCPGGQGEIDLTAGGGTPQFSYLWSNNATSEDVNISQSGNYTVTVTDLNGCTATETATVSILGTIPVLSFTTDTLTCQKTSGVISVSADVPNTSFLWSGAGGFSANNAAPVITTNGAFSVTVTEPLGACSAVGSVTVPMDTLKPTIMLAEHLLEIPCDQDSAFISAEGSSNGPGFSIEWSTTTGGQILSGANTLSPLVGSAGFYAVLIRNLSNGCTASDAVEVFKTNSPSGAVSADSVRCFGEANGAIHISPGPGGTPPLMYSIDNLNFTNNPVFNNLAAGNYSAFIRDAEGCTFSSSVEIAQPAPISVVLTGDTLVVKATVAHLQAVVSPATNWPLQIEWSANGVPFAQSQLEQSMQLLQPTLFQISLTDEHDCVVSDTRLVKVDAGHKVFAPNAISLENTSGANQVFLIFAGPDVQEIEYLNIFDRWGDQVFANRHFQPNDESQGWDGAFRGKAVSAGVFVWKARLVYKDGSAEVLSGDLTVIR
jgi:PKD repeat protein